MSTISAGLVMVRRGPSGMQVLLVHPGGPFWAGKDLGAWTIPKGVVEPGEDLLAAAIREFREETGLDPAGPFVPLLPVRQKGGKVVHAWAFRGDCDPAAVRGNPFSMAWPPRSGTIVEFPEIDRAAWFDLREARRRILAGQAPLLDGLDKV